MTTASPGAHCQLGPAGGLRDPRAPPENPLPTPGRGSSGGLGQPRPGPAPREGFPPARGAPAPSSLLLEQSASELACTEIPAAAPPPRSRGLEREDPEALVKAKASLQPLLAPTLPGFTQNRARSAHSSAPGARAPRPPPPRPQPPFPPPQSQQPFCSRGKRLVVRPGRSRAVREVSAGFRSAERVGEAQEARLPRGGPAERTPGKATLTREDPSPRPRGPETSLRARAATVAGAGK